MKINSDISKDFFSLFDEARGIALRRKKILKNKSSKCLTYMQRKLLILAIMFVVSLFFLILCCWNMNMILISWIVALVAVVYLIHAIATIALVYFYRKDQDFKNTITIDKHGITDESYFGIKMTFRWEKITGVVIGKRTVTILTDMPIYFYFDISSKDDIIKAIEKYGDSKKIIK